ncbi:endolytic transglycosylase MltG [Fulvivirgaceae bacterium PWU4]|uniref:Endolytic murein transglycosylase n=1 Tax=Chryseosolibacter histidini TaxID=2782349 RepID=A0AAP2DJ73_9BACT|nr:endolytic transglycosylase MltG [Chryseosolibacter histidini]MBT1697215.1 endolytic transglycosylase MltG [Chryseosolibacter histidini]
MKPSKKLIFFLLLSILLISFTYYGFQICYTPNVLVEKQDREITIPKGATFKDVQKIFHEGDITQDLISFSFLSKLMDYDENVKAGRYLLRANMTNLQAIRLLRSGQQEPVKITFNNVRLISELSEKITRNLFIKKEEFEAALVQFAMTNRYGFNKDNVLTMFIPNTYEVYYQSSAEEVIERMHQEYEKFWTADRKAKAQKEGFTPIEVSILASIVQAESVQKDEAPIIAGLYINRLKEGIPLQADPTLVFAVGDFTLKRVLNEHKEVDSPYNTYKYAGLPPGPVNMPEIRSIDAVLNHAQTDYLYMCAKEDFSGRHNFTGDYDQHINNAKRYQRALTIEIQKGRQNKKK